MKALHFDGKRLREKRIASPKPNRKEALIKVTLAGICSTDLEILKGYMGFQGVPGHEFVGTVVTAPGTGLVGKRVTGEINIPCNKCRVCRMGLEKHCPDRSVLGISGRNGAFAEFLTLPAGNLHIVPDGVSDEEAVFTELLAAACEIPERLKIERGSRIAVLGDGRLAAMAAQVLAARTKDVLLFGVHPKKLQTISGIGLQVTNLTEKEQHLRSFDIVVECTGNPEGLPLAARLARARGTIVLKSTYHPDSTWNPSEIVVNEQTILGSRCGPFEKALRMIDSKQVKVLPFLTAVYPFDRWQAAIRRARRRDSFKVVLDFHR